MTELSSRVITIHKRKTTMRLCKNEWEALKDICKREKINRKMLLEMIESRKDPKLGLSRPFGCFRWFICMNCPNRCWRNSTNRTTINQLPTFWIKYLKSAPLVPHIFYFRTLHRSGGIGNRSPSGKTSLFINTAAFPKGYFLLSTQPVTAGFSVALNRITVQFSGFCQKDTGIIINFGDFLITHNFSFLFAKKRSGLYSLEAAEPMLNKHSLLQALCVVLICLNISKILS